MKVIAGGVAHNDAAYLDTMFARLEAHSAQINDVSLDTSSPAYSIIVLRQLLPRPEACTWNHTGSTILGYAMSAP